MILIDPKKVELNHYEGIPHLLTPVVTNMKNASAVLANVVREMESRYDLMGQDRARNIRDWNETREARGDKKMPTILVLIDELADLMMVSPAEVEDAIIRLAQKSRAVGIHLVLATQRPSVDVITGMIKANVPSRIAFAVSSQVDSRVVLDATGAESLLGAGDMLFRPIGTSRLQRLQGAYVSEEEILAITDHWRRQGKPELREDLLERPEVPEDDPLDPDADDLIAKAIEMVVAQGTASVSLLQRRLGVGYARAGRLVDVMERMGVISGHEGSKPRTVLVGEGDLDRILRRTTPDDDADEDARRSLITTRAGSLKNPWYPATGAARLGCVVLCSKSGTHSERRAFAVRSTSPTANRRRRSAPNICVRSRRSSSRSLPGADLRQRLPAHVRRVP